MRVGESRATRSGSGGGCRHYFGWCLELAERRGEYQRQQHQIGVRLAMDAAVGRGGEGERVGRRGERGAFIVRLEARVLEVPLRPPSPEPANPDPACSFPRPTRPRPCAYFHHIPSHALPKIRFAAWGFVPVKTRTSYFHRAVRNPYSAYS